MPILFKENKFCHFAHIPKCGGISIEKYCRDIGLKIGFLDNYYVSKPAPQPWTLSSPQHVDGYSLTRLIPLTFFNFGFAVVRDPISRFISAFKWQKFRERKIKKSIDINTFISEELVHIVNKIGQYDNHFLPQIKFFVKDLNYTVFSLAQNLEPVKKFIDNEFLGFDADTKMGHHNKTVDVPSSVNLNSELTDISLKILRDIYSEDYEKFNIN